MADMMTFPDTWEEFEEYYGITDREQIYTNGARLIPSFRVKQWLDHLDDYVPREFHDKTCEEMARRHQAEIAELTADRPQGEWVSNHDGSWNCSECGLRVFIYAKGNYCPNCGARMKGADDE